MTNLFVGVIVLLGGVVVSIPVIKATEWRRGDW